MYNFRTDLASERRDIYQKSNNIGKEIDGIESAYTDFDYNNKFNVNIFITYNDEIIGKEKINELKEQFNSY